MNVFDRVLDGDDVAVGRAIDAIDEGCERGRLPAPGRPSEKREPRRALGETRHGCREREFFEAGDAFGQQPYRDAQAAGVPIGVEAIRRAVSARRRSTVRSACSVEARQLHAGKCGGEEGPDRRVIDRRCLEHDQTAVDAQPRPVAAAEVQIGRGAVASGANQRSDAHRADTHESASQATTRAISSNAVTPSRTFAIPSAIIGRKPDARATFASWTLDAPPAMASRAASSTAMSS